MHAVLAGGRDGGGTHKEGKGFLEFRDLLFRQRVGLSSAHSALATESFARHAVNLGGRLCRLLCFFFLHTHPPTTRRGSWQTLFLVGWEQ